MQRFLQIYGGVANGGVNGNDSIVSNDFNWNELSIGNNDTLAENSFFGKSNSFNFHKNMFSLDRFVNLIPSPQLGDNDVF